MLTLFFKFIPTQRLTSRLRESIDKVKMCFSNSGNDTGITADNQKKPSSQCDARQQCNSCVLTPANNKKK